MKYFINVFVLIVVFLLLNSCIPHYQHHGREFDPSLVSKIEKGRTTEAEILSMFGNPIRTQFNSDGTKLIFYAFTKTEGVINLIPFVPTLYEKSKGNSLWISIDKNNIVTNYQLQAQEFEQTL